MATRGDEQQQDRRQEEGDGAMADDGGTLSTTVPNDARENARGSEKPEGAGGRGPDPRAQEAEGPTQGRTAA